MSGASNEFLRIPYESIVKHFRLRQKAVEKLLSECAENSAGQSREESIASLRQLREDVRMHAERELEACDQVLERARIIDLSRTDEPVAIDEAIARYIVRSGVLDIADPSATSIELATARELAEACAALRSGNCAPAMEWVASYASRLRRVGADPAFHLKLLNFRCILESEGKPAALAFAEAELSPAVSAQAGAEASDIDATNAEWFQAAMASLAIRDPRTSSIEKTRLLFSDGFRDELATRLQREGLIAIGFSPESDLERLVASGVVALSYDTGSGTSDATQHVPEPFTCLQAHLPKSHVARSVLICRVTGAEMNAANPPIALPNGQVFSASAVEAATSKQTGRVTCPVTHEEFNAIDCHRVYPV